MKKITLILGAVAFMSATLTSCKKDYDCVCKDSTTSQTITLKDMKKKDATSACDTYNALWALGSGSCSIQ